MIQAEIPCLCQREDCAEYVVFSQNGHGPEFTCLAGHQQEQTENLIQVARVVVKILEKRGLSK